MALCVIKKAMSKLSISPLKTIQLFKNYSLWTPNYLELMKPEIPIYPVINVQIKGYDYPILEKYQRFIHKIVRNMNIELDDSFALPPKKLKIERIKPFSTVIEVEYKLNVYERNSQLSNISSTQLPIFIRLLEATVPQGVMLKIEEWNAEKEEYRFVPDKELLDLKDQLETMKKK